MSGRGFEDLEVWKEAMMLAKEVYMFTRALPEDEKFGLVQQMRRCAVSVASNIAEGSARQTAADFRRFLTIAAGSAAELKTQAMIVQDVFSIHGEPPHNIILRCNKIGRMITGLKKKVKDKTPATSNQQPTTTTQKEEFAYA